MLLLCPHTARSAISLHNNSTGQDCTEQSWPKNRIVYSSYNPGSTILAENQDYATILAKKQDFNEQSWLESWREHFPGFTILVFGQDYCVEDVHLVRANRADFT